MGVSETILRVPLTLVAIFYWVRAELAREDGRTNDLIWCMGAAIIYFIAAMW